MTDVSGDLLCLLDVSTRTLITSFCNVTDAAVRGSGTLSVAD